MAANPDEFAAYKDLARIPQDDGPTPVVAINYNPNFVIAHDYFRAILQKNEISERGLDISTKVILLNSANYTAWQYRRQCIFDLKKNLYDELEFSETIARKSPKNYQLWWHRRMIINGIFDNANLTKNNTSNDNNNDSDNNNSNSDVDYSEGYDLNLEKELIRSILAGDAKNYHAWSHLHWLLRTYDGFLEDELEYCDKLLKNDVRNNSAWNHRHFVVKTLLSFSNYDVCIKEIEYCQKKLLRLGKNDSIWYYYSDITLNQLPKAMKNELNKNKNKNTNNKGNDESKKNENEEKNSGDNTNSNNSNINSTNSKEFNIKWREWKDKEIRFIKELLEKQPYCGRAMLYYVDLLNDKNVECINDGDLDVALELLDALGEKMDRVRYNYYKYLKENIEKRKKQLSGDNTKGQKNTNSTQNKPVVTNKSNEKM